MNPKASKIAYSATALLLEVGEDAVVAAEVAAVLAAGAVVEVKVWNEWLEDVRWTASINMAL